MTVVTRFAPSPTGSPHIGGVRTALFNYLYAKHHGGQYKLRIEDTDEDRNYPESTTAILDGLSWLGLAHDGDVVFQSARAGRHREVAAMLVERGAAYEDFTTPFEMEQLRDDWKIENPKAPFRYLNNPWREPETRDAFTPGIRPVVRIKAPRDGETAIDDLVQGRVTVQNSTLDDMIILRSDGSPTYMLAVVVDDYDAGVNTIIRGDDHLNNTFRQLPIYRAMGWDVPRYAHIPLIHNEQGNKLSKRNGDASISDYRLKGILPDAMFNYLLKLGWGHGDDEIISREQATEWFDIVDVGRAPARLDDKKLMSVNAHYLRESSDIDLVFEVLKAFPDDRNQHIVDLLKAAMPSLKVRATNLVDLTESARFYIERPTGGTLVNSAIMPVLFEGDFTREAIEDRVRRHADRTGWKLKDIVAPLRLAITGSKVSPPLFEVMELLGRQEIEHRLGMGVMV